MHHNDNGQFGKIYFTKFQPINVPVMLILEALGYEPITQNSIPKIKKNDLVFFTYSGPQFDWGTGWSANLFWECVNKKVRCVLVILHVHHLMGARLLEEEKVIFNAANYIIVLNDDMEDYFEKIGIKAKLVNMELFDFLANDVVINDHQSCKKLRNQLVYAGGIEDEFRHSFFNDFPHTFSLDFFGLLNIKSPSNLISNSQYKGFFSNEDLPTLLKGDFGLIWMDAALVSHTQFEKYWHISTSSKLPLYLASGLPIICKKGTGDEKVVEKYQIGFAISSLEEIDERLLNISEHQYQTFRNNVLELAQKTTEGYFLKRAVKFILDDIQHI